MNNSLWTCLHFSWITLHLILVMPALKCSNTAEKRETISSLHEWNHPHPDKSNLHFLPKFNSRLERDKQMSAWIDDSLSHYLLTWSILGEPGVCVSGGGWRYGISQDQSSDFVFPWKNWAGTHYFAPPSSNWVTFLRTSLSYRWSMPALWSFTRIPHLLVPCFRSPFRK